MNKSHHTRKSPGPKPRVVPWNVANTAYRFAQLLKSCEQEIDWDRLLSAKTEEDVRAAFQGIAMDYREDLLARIRPSLVLAWLYEGKFPKRRREFLIGHLADSLAGEGLISFRRSRDLVATQRRRERRRGRIIRVEFYVECTCGFKGVSRDHACRRCGARVEIPPWAAQSSESTQ